VGHHVLRSIRIQLAWMQANSGAQEMKSVVAAWMLAFGLIASHLGCCTVPMAGDRCGVGLCDSGCGVAESCDCGSCGGLPFSGVRSRIAGKLASIHCTSGCGEVYWDEHINEPPVCDPCGCNGEFTGDACGSCPTALGRLRNLWTHHRYCPSTCDTCPSDASPVQGGSCSSCNGDHSGYTHAHTSSTSYSNVNSPAPMTTTTERVRTQTAPSTPTARPATPRAQPQHVPVPDPNASIRVGSPSERVVVGSGVTEGKSSSVTKTTGGIRLTTSRR
jgi:hypothetical protein